MVAAQEAARWLERDHSWDTSTIVTYSISLVDAVQEEATQPELRSLQEVLWRLHDGGRSTQICWVPGHCGLPSYEITDRIATEGADMEQEGIDILEAPERQQLKDR